MVKIDDKQACQIHGIISSDSDSDCDGKKEFDEEYNLLKPPPLDIESIKDRLVVISPEHDPEPTNVWEERMKITENATEADDQIDSNATSLSKKKKKRGFIHVIRSLSDEDLSTDASVSESPTKKQPDKIWYDPEILKEMREQLDRLDYYGLRNDIFTQELNVLQEQGDIGCFKNSNDPQRIKPKKKKKKQKHLTEDMQQVSEEPKQKIEVVKVATNEDKTVKETVYEENQSKPLENQQIKTTEASNTMLPTTSANNKSKISPLQELEYAFGTNFKQFLQSVISDGASISELNSFSYEQLSSVYKAYLQKKKSTATSGLVGNVKNAPVQQNMFYPTFQNNTPVTTNIRCTPVQQSGFYPTLQNTTAWNGPINQNAYQTYPPVQQNSLPWNYAGHSNSNMIFPYFYTITNPSPSIRLDFYLPPNPNGANFINASRCIPSTSTDKVILTEIEDVKTTDTKDNKNSAVEVQQNLNSNNVAMISEKTAGSVQDASESVAVKGKCEVKNIQADKSFFYSQNFDKLFKHLISISTEGRKIIISVYEKAEDRIEKPQYLMCKEHLIGFVRINNKALDVIERCLEMCTQIKNGKKSNGTMINDKIFIRNFQYAEAVFSKCIEDLENIERGVIDICNMQYNPIMRYFLRARGVLGKCKLACKDINNEIKKSGCDSTQIDEIATSKNDSIKGDEGLASYFTNSNESVTSAHKTMDQSVTVEEGKCEVKNIQVDENFLYSQNFDTLLKRLAQVFKEGHEIIISVYSKMENRIEKPRYLKCNRFLVDFLRINDKALYVIERCLEMCTQIKNEKDSNGRMTDTKFFITNFRHSEAVLGKCIEDLENCEREVIDIFNMQYNVVMRFFLKARCVLGKWKLACNDINNEIKKNSYDSAQIDETAISKNDFIKRDEGLASNLTNLNESVTSANKTNNDSERFLFNLEKSNVPEETNFNSMQETDMSVDSKLSKNKNEQVKEVVENLSNVGSVQDYSQNVTVKEEKCEVKIVQVGENFVYSKNFDTLLKGCIQTFTESRQTALSLNQKVENRIKKAQFIKCKEHMIKFLKVNEEVLSIIKPCLEKCTQIKNGKKSNDTLKVFTREFQYSETALDKCIEDIEDCERKVIDIFTTQYNVVMKVIIKMRGVLGKCKLACKDINYEIRKSGYDSAQIDETPTLMNDSIKRDEGLASYFTNSNESLTSANKTNNDSDSSLLNLKKSNVPEETISNSMQETDMSVDSKLSKNKNEKVKEVMENLSNVGSVQDTSQSVTVKETKCEVKNVQAGENFFYSENVDASLSDSIQVFTEGSKTILSVYRKAQEMITKREFSECAHHIANFSLINEEALHVIRRCLEMCTLVQNEESKGTIVKNKKDFIKDLQYSEMVLSMRVENVKNCEKRLMNVYKTQYNRFVDIIIVSCGTLEKCKLACNNINKEIKKSICESAQVEGTASKNDSQETRNALFLETNEDNEKKSVTKDKALHERNTDYLNDENIQSTSTQQNINLNQNDIMTDKKTGTKNKEKLTRPINEQDNDLETKERINEILGTQDNTVKIQSINTEPEKTNSNGMRESLVIASSVQDFSQIVTVKEEKCEVKDVQTAEDFFYSQKFDASLKRFIQVFMESHQTIRSVSQKAETLLTKSHFSNCEKHITDFLRICEEALGIISLVWIGLEKCICLQNGKRTNGTVTNVKEFFLKDFQYSESVLKICIEDIENCERRLLHNYKADYTRFIEVIIIARAMLGKCKVTCNDINEEIRKCENVQVVENSSNVESVQETFQNVAVKEEKCEVKNVQRSQHFFHTSNFHTLLSSSLKTFTESSKAIFLEYQRVIKFITKPQISQCKEHMIEFLRINEMSLRVIRRCLEMCTVIQDEKKTNRTIIKDEEVFVRDFQHSKTMLDKCIEDLENSQRRLLEDYMSQYNRFIKIIIVARAVLGKCRLACNNINEEVKKSETAQVDEPVSLKNDFIEEDEGLALHLIDSNEVVMSAQENTSDNKTLLLSLEKPNDSLKSSQETGNNSEALPLETNEDEKNKSITNDKALCEGITDNLDNVNDVPCTSSSTKNSTPFSSMTKDSFYENVNFMQVIEYFLVGFSSDLSWGYIALFTLLVYLLIAATECVFSFLGDNFFFIWAAVLIFVYLKN